MRTHINRYPTPARTYYVDATGGAAANTGTAENLPYQTIATVNALPLKPGDRVLFKCGETWDTTALTPPASGTFQRPIIFASYGSGAKPVFTGVTSRCWLISVKSNLRFHNLATDNVALNYGVAIFAFNAGEVSTNLLFEDCDFGASALACVYLSGGTTVGCQRYRFVRCAAHDGVEQGWFHYSTSGINSRDIEYIDCTAYNNGTTVNQHHGWYIQYADDIRLRDCVAYDNVGHGMQWQGGITNALMIDSESRSNDSQGVWLSGLTAGGNNNFINNLVHQNADSGFEIGATVAQANIYHNTIVNNGAGGAGNRQGVVLYDGTSGVVFKNNLVKQDEGVVGQFRNCIKATTADELGAAQGNILDYNLYQYDNTYSGKPFNVAGTEKTLAQWQAYDGSQDAHSQNADPTFVTEYTDLHLQAASNGIGDGDPAVGVLTDKDGVVRGVAVDQGCYEYVA